MSSFVSEAARTLESDTPPKDDDAPQGQQHDRIPVSQQDTNAMASSGEGNISTTQRMISATWGSILTSLLGRSIEPA
jgi:hypothetical protein